MDKMAPSIAKSLFIELVVVRLSVLPASKDHALPFVSQRPHGRVVRLASGTLVQVASGRPPTPKHALLSVFVKALPVIFRAQIPPMDVAFAATLFSDRRYACVVLQV